MTTSRTDQWQPSAVTPPLTSDVVHVWRTELDAPSPIVDALKAILSKDELDRAEQFLTQRLRHRYVAGRACLRILLGDYLVRQPASLEFRYGSSGKPALTCETARDCVHFNLAHSRSTALFAFARNRRVGIDVEHWRRMEDGSHIAQRFFAPEEVEQLAKLPPDDWRRGFFACWTRKEAYIKARGEGLVVPLNEFAITVQPDNRVAIVRSEIDPTDVDRWSVVELDPEPECSGSVVVEGSGWSLQRLRLPHWPDQIDGLPPLIRQSV